MPEESPVTEPLQRTPLHDRHVALGAKLVAFAGWEMPVQYDGLVQEHHRVRAQAGVFDVSHMGELFFEGPGAGATLDHLATNDVASLQDGQVLYTALCNERGGTRDDALVYRLGPARYLLVVNAANTAKVHAWARAHLRPGTALHDVSGETALLAVQGPRSLEVLERCRTLGALAAGLRGLAYYRFVHGEVDGAPLVVSRTGYTGELGYEIYLPPARAGALWDELLVRGRPSGLGPAGLGARDTLRFEVGYCLYGHELEEDVSPLEAGIGWTVKLKKPDFLGRTALFEQKAAGLPRRLVGFEIPDEARAIARQGYEVRRDGRQVGRVTSGTWAPTVGKSLGLALVESAAAGGPLAVAVRGREVGVRIVPVPFHAPGGRG
jgi:aminomethyltransferase